MVGSSWVGVLSVPPPSACSGTHGAHRGVDRSRIGKNREWHRTCKGSLAARPDPLASEVHVNRFSSLRRLLTHSLFQTALLGIPALSLLLGACTQQIGGTGSTSTGSTSSGSTSSGSTTGSSTGGGGAGGQGSSAAGSGGGTGCPPSMASGTGYFIEVGHPCFPWTDIAGTGGGGMGGSATGTGGGGGNTAVECPGPKMAPASWGLDMYPNDSVVGPIDKQHLDGTCCYEIELLCF